MLLMSGSGASQGGPNLKWQRVPSGATAGEAGPSQAGSSLGSGLAEASAAAAQGAAQAALDASDRGESAQTIVSALANKDAIMVSYLTSCFRTDSMPTSRCLDERWLPQR